MRQLRLSLVVVILLLVAAALLGAGYLVGHQRSSGAEQQFESCSFDGGLLVLGYTYGANQVVTPSIDTTGRDVVVRLTIEQGEGSTPSIGLTGEARFGIFGSEETTIRYADGTVIDCPAT